MENTKFNLLLHDVKSGKYNVNKIQILECYIAQKFTVTQILLLTQPLTTSDARLKGFSSLVKEMLVCKAEEAICLISSLGTDPKHIGNQLICLGELLKHRKVNLDESEKHSLFDLFQGTTAEEEACTLLKLTPRSISNHLPAQHQMPPAGESFHPRSRTPDQLPITSNCTPDLRQATATTPDTFTQYPQAKTSGTPGQPHHPIPIGTPGQSHHPIPTGTPGQSHHPIPTGTPGQSHHPIPSGTPSQSPHPIPTGTPGQSPHPIPSGTPGQSPHPIPTGTPGQSPHPIPSRTPGQPHHPIPTGTPGQSPHPIPTGTPSQPPHTLQRGIPGQSPHPIPNGTPGQPPHTLQRGILGYYPYSIPNTADQPTNLSICHNTVPTYQPYQMYHHAHSGPPLPQFPANVVNPSAIGFIVPEDTLRPPQPQTTFPNGPPPGLGFTV